VVLKGGTVLYTPQSNVWVDIFLGDDSRGDLLERRIFDVGYKYWQGGSTVPAHCLPYQAPRWWLRYQYGKRGWLYKCYDEELLSALIGEMVKQEIITSNDFELCSDYVLIFVDYKTNRCRYYIPGIRFNMGYLEKPFWVITGHAFCFDNYRAEFVFEGGNKEPTYIATQFDVKSSEFRYIGTYCSSGKYMPSNHFNKVVDKLPCKEITFNEWFTKTTEGFCSPVLIFQYKSLSIGYVSGVERHEHEFL